LPKLRLEPKIKAPITETEYGQYKDLLQKAKANAGDHHVLVDLEEGENSTYVRKAINFVAGKEGKGTVMGTGGAVWSEDRFEGVQFRFVGQTRAA
jgi:hypothetical protein